AGRVARRTDRGAERLAEVAGRQPGDRSVRRGLFVPWCRVRITRLVAVRAGATDDERGGHAVAVVGVAAPRVAGAAATDLWVQRRGVLGVRVAEMIAGGAGAILPGAEGRERRRRIRVVVPRRKALELRAVERLDRPQADLTVAEQHLRRLRRVGVVDGEAGLE